MVTTVRPKLHGLKLVLFNSEVILYVKCVSLINRHMDYIICDSCLGVLKDEVRLVESYIHGQSAYLYFGTWCTAWFVGLCKMKIRFLS